MEKIVAVNKFAKLRHFQGNPEYTVCMISEEELIEALGKGVWEERQEGDLCDVHLSSPDIVQRFLTNVTRLREGDVLEGRYEARRGKGEEEPRMHVRVVKDDFRDAYSTGRLPAKSVTVILYSSEKLAKDGEDHVLPAEPGNYEVVSINASPYPGKEPMHPDTLMANYFGRSGGSDHGETMEQFVAKLKACYEFWSCHAMAVKSNKKEI
tara:strand:- start:4288 stop:4914 length:627 start_codon:yes stop_codon:yes gene_type:complete